MAVKVVNEAGVKFAWLAGRVPPRPLTGTFIAKATLAMRPGGISQLLAEDDMADADGDRHLDEDEEKSLVYASDFALFKPHADLLLKGTCYAPGGQPATVCSVSFRVGGWSKSIAVIGDRHWKASLFSSSMSEPLPFSSMPVVWERAFGGPSFKKNPRGRGIEETPDESGRSVRPAPNLEYLDRLVTRASQTPDPSCFAPVALEWAPRHGKAGTYGRRYVAERWPWFPDDFDWTLFNAAPDDQQLRSFLRGDETIVCENLHPSVPRYETKLPGVTVRWFLRKQLEGKTTFEEVPMHLDTLHVDMDAEQIILLWRGIAGIGSLKMKEISHHFIVSEPLGAAPIELTSRSEQMDARLLEEEKEKELTPLDMEPRAQAPLELPAPTWAAELKKEMDTLEAQAEELKKEQMKLFANATDADGNPLLPPGGFFKPPDLKGIAESLKEAEQAFGKLLESQPEAAAKVGFRPDFASIQAEVEALEEAESDERTTAEPPPAAPQPWTRDRVVEHIATGGRFENEDLSGLDLSRIDLSGADFGEAILKGTIFAGSKLTSARFSKANLAQASFRECDLANADLSEADLRGADFTLAKADRASFCDADGPGAIFSGARLRGARGSNSTFTEADFTEVDLTEADFTAADFTGSTIARANCSKAILRRADFSDTRGQGIQMSEAILETIRASGAALDDAGFVSADGPGSIWEGASLANANFSGATLIEANFTESVLSGASFYLANLSHARMADAKLDGAKLVKANLFRATLEGADLTGCDCRSSNFYEVEFYNAVLTGADFQLSNLKRSKLE